MTERMRAGDTKPDRASATRDRFLMAARLPEKPQRRKSGLLPVAGGTTARAFRKFGWL